nr:hypothetical protein BaRGS_014304 [Batillaria attramentaria]
MLICPQLHERGLKLGIYTDIGYSTCQKLPGTEFYMKQDAETFARWGVDLVKTDGCNAALNEMDISYPVFGFYLNQTGRPMVYCCSWAAAQVVHGIMLVVGDYGLSYYQWKAQFGMWAMLASPLFMSVDLRTIPPAAKDILLNKGVIAINQDPLGAQAIRLYEVSVNICI